MNVVQPIYYKEKDDKSTNPNDTIQIVFMILHRILDYTKDLEEKTPSIFDHNHSHDNNKSSISTSFSDSSSNSDLCCILDKYDIEDYIIQVYKKLGFSTNLLILSMMNLDKLLANNFILTSENVHKVFFLCMMETQKYYDDEYFRNKDYSKVSGISTKELLELELEFLNNINFNIFIKDDEYNKYKKKLQELCQKQIIITNNYIKNEDEEDETDDSY